MEHTNKLTARVCVFCKQPKGTIAFRQDRAVLDAAEIPHVGGAFFAHLKCVQFWRRRRAVLGAMARGQ